MHRPLRLLAIGFDSPGARPLLEAARALGPERVAWRSLPASALRQPDPLVQALDGADGLLFTTLLDPEQAAALLPLLQGRPWLAVIPAPPNAPELMATARLGLPDPAREREVLGRLLQALQNLSPANGRIALATLLWALCGEPEPPLPERYPRGGFWHPDHGFLPEWRLPAPAGATGRVGLVAFRPQVVAGDDAHLRALIAALEGEGLEVIPWCGTLDALPERPAIPGLDLWINASGFTLMGSHARPDIEGDIALLRELDTPCLAPVPLFGQPLPDWEASRLGLGPMQVAMQVSIPELEGAIAPVLFAGRDPAGEACLPVPEQVGRIARLARRYVALRRTPNREKRVAITLFSFPPDQGAVGTAAYLDVFASLHQLLLRMREAGYTVAVPDSPEALQRLVSDGVAARYPAARYAAAFPEVERVSRCWGRPPGEVLNDGTHFLIQGCRLENVFIGIQPPFGYEGDPMALLFHPEASPSHAFAAYYTWLREELQPHALLHFGTHGSLEFMPGKQVGLAPRDYPDRLIGDLPHLYFYCINNPAEGAIARRRSAAALLSYLSPPLGQAGLYGTLAQLREELHLCRSEPEPERRAARLEAVRALAAEAGFDPRAGFAPEKALEPEAVLDRLAEALAEVSGSLIPLGLHVAGKGIRPEEARPILRAALEHDRPERGLTAPPPELADQLLEALHDPARLAALGLEPVAKAGWAAYLRELEARLKENDELGAILHALDGGYIPPGPGGDPVREPATLPTGRNLHAVNPYKLPTPIALRRGRELAERLLASGPLPESVALVLWGIDNIKTGGEGIAQAFALLGVEPELDATGRMVRFRILPLAELGRPRIDVVITASGIFRDLFPTAMALLDQAIRAVAQLDEEPADNLLRAHALKQAAELGLDLADAAARLFTTPAGQYGAGVNRVVEGSAWEAPEELAETFLARMGQAHGRSLPPETQRALLRSALSTVSLTFQNIDSTEISLADVDHYYEYLGGVTAAVRAVRREEPRAVVADSYAARPKLRSLAEALRLESRTRLLNPRWHEAMLAHGYSGVHQVAQRLENTFGWAATTGAVDGWIFTAAAETFLYNEGMRRRMAEANPRALLRMADRLAEAAQRGLWAAAPEDLDRLEAIAGELDSRAEGVAL
ncbi:MAG: cobaltochelatase subunit CobN [Bacillota bacterium]